MNTVCPIQAIIFWFTANWNTNDWYGTVGAWYTTSKVHRIARMSENTDSPGDGSATVSVKILCAVAIQNLRMRMNESL